MPTAHAADFPTVLRGSVPPDETVAGMVFSCAVFSDVPGSRKSAQNTADLGVFRQKDGGRHRP